MKNILFPTDFSDTATNAFIYALRIANKFNAKITTLHVYSRPDIKGVKLPKTLSEVYDSIDLEEFENFRDTVPKFHQIAEEEGMNHIEMTNLMIDGSVIETIINIAKKVDADMIIMGTKGAGWIKKIFIGSIAGEVLENAFCPVLAVPKEAKFDGKIDNIAITTTFSEDEKLAFERLIAWASNFDANIYCVNVDSKRAKDTAEKMDDWRMSFEKKPNVHYYTVKDSNLVEGISYFVVEKEIDILAMLSRRRGFFEELFHYSRVKELSYHTAVPILSIQMHVL